MPPVSTPEITKKLAGPPGTVSAPGIPDPELEVKPDLQGTTTGRISSTEPNIPNTPKAAAPPGGMPEDGFLGDFNQVTTSQEPQEAVQETTGALTADDLPTRFSPKWLTEQTVEFLERATQIPGLPKPRVIRLQKELKNR